MFGLKFATKKGPTLGLDLNSFFLSLIELEKTKAGHQVTRFAQCPAPAESMREGIIIDPEPIAERLKELIEGSGLPPTPMPTVNLAVPSHLVVIRLLPVPVGMPPDELAEVVNQEAINHLPFPLADARLDWSIMPATERTDPDGVNRVDVILAGVQKALVDAYWRLAEMAGLSLGKIEVASMAVLKALSFGGYLSQIDRVTMSVSVRSDGTNINLVRAGMPLFSRSVPLGLDSLVESVSRSLDIKANEVVSILPQIPLAGITAADLDAKIGQAAQVARTVFGDIIDEVSRSLDFYRSQAGDVELDRIVLTGGGVNIPQLDVFLSNRLNAKCTIADPFSELSYDPQVLTDELRPNQALVLGLALDSTMLPVATVDLDLNKEGPSDGALDGVVARSTVRIVHEEVPATWFKPTVMAGSVILAVITLYWVFLTQYDTPKKEAELTRVEKQIGQEKARLMTLPKLQDKDRTLQGKKAVLDRIIKFRHPWSAVLEAVRESTPEGVQIKKISLLGSTFTIEGVAIEFAKASHLAINLSNLPVVAESSLTLAKRQDKSGDPRVIQFEITGKVRSTALADKVATTLATPAIKVPAAPALAK